MHIEPRNVRAVFNPEQRTAVVRAFNLARHDGPLLTAPVTSEDERIFLERDTLTALPDVRMLEKDLQQILRRKVWVVERTDQWGTAIPFE